MVFVLELRLTAAVYVSGTAAIHYAISRMCQRLVCANCVCNLHGLPGLSKHTYLRSDLARPAGDMMIELSS